MLVLQLALSFPGGRLTRAARVAVGFAYAGLLVGAVSTARQAALGSLPGVPAQPVADGRHRELSDVLWSSRSRSRSSRGA